jgi:hypothetical protein
MKSILLFAAAALALPAAFVACDKPEDDNNKAPETPAKINVAASQTDDTLRISYNGALELSKIFSVEQPEGGAAKLVYAVERQPDYAENDGGYTPLPAYRVGGDTLVALPDVRVPDALNKGEGRMRVVREGLLKVSAEGVDTLTYTIKMTGKPALTPVISVDPEITGLVDGNKLVLQTITGGRRIFTVNSFTISPIDFGRDDIRVGTGGSSDYITTDANGVPQAGGLNAAYGTGSFVVAYYKDNTLEQVLRDETLPQARLYVDVELVESTAVVGIELKPNIGQCNTNSFWRNNANGSQFAYNFIIVKLNNGETRNYDGQTDSNLRLLTGGFNEYLQGIGDESESHAGWFPKVSLLQGDPIGTAALPPAGTTVSFTITSTAHFNEPGWTVTVTTQTLAANPGLCN